MSYNTSTGDCYKTISSSIPPRKKLLQKSCAIQRCLLAASMELYRNENQKWSCSSSSLIPSVPVCATIFTLFLLIYRNNPLSVKYEAFIIHLLMQKTRNGSTHTSLFPYLLSGQPRMYRSDHWKDIDKLMGACCNQSSIDVQCGAAGRMKSH